MRFLLPFAAALLTLSSYAHATTLAALPSAGETVTEGDVVFSNFILTDERSSVLTGDFMPTADGIDVQTSSTANTVNITFDFAPDVSVSGLTDGFRPLFSFSIDFDVAVAGSSRTFEAVELSAGTDDILVQDQAFAEVETKDDITSPTFLLNIGKQVPLGSVPDSTSDSTNLASLTNLSLLNFIDGVSQSADASATLSAFSLTFTLAGDNPPPPPPPNVVPLPAGLPLLLSGLGGLAWLRRRKKAANA